MRIACTETKGDNGSFSLTVNVCDENQESSPIDVVFAKTVENGRIKYKMDYPKCIHVASDIIYNLLLIDNPGPYNVWRKEIKDKIILLDKRADQEFLDPRRGRP